MSFLEKIKEKLYFWKSQRIAQEFIEENRTAFESVEYPVYSGSSLRSLIRNDDLGNFPPTGAISGVISGVSTLRRGLTSTMLSSSLDEQERQMRHYQDSLMYGNSLQFNGLADSITPWKSTFTGKSLEDIQKLESDLQEKTERIEYLEFLLSQEELK